MLKLIWQWTQVQGGTNTYLNTSHVEVNQGTYLQTDTWIDYLNTSHVEVNPEATARIKKFLKEFKYISC